MKKSVTTVIAIVALFVVATATGCATDVNREVTTSGQATENVHTEDLPESIGRREEVIEAIDDLSDDSNYVTQTPEELFIQFDGLLFLYGFVYCKRYG